MMRAILTTFKALIWAVLITVSVPFFWQIFTGGTTLVVSGTSMVPTYERGDIVFLNHTDKPLTPDFWIKGDIVAVSFVESDPENNQYIHRVHEVLGDGRAILKGDGNPEPDVSPVTLGQVVGQPGLVLHQPLADIYVFTQTWFGRIAIFGIGIALLVIIEHHTGRRRTRRTPAPEPTGPASPGPSSDSSQPPALPSR